MLMRISTQAAEELQLWLTRRLTLALMPAFNTQAAEQLGKGSQVDPAAPPDVQKARLVDGFKREAAAYQGDFATPYQPPAATPINGEQPLLVTDVALTLLGTGQLRVKFSQKLDGVVKDLEISMVPQLTQGMLQLLTQALRQSGWLDVPALAGQPAATVDPLALLAAAEKPGYLN